MRRDSDLRRYERQHVGVQIRLHLLGLVGRQFDGIELADAQPLGLDNIFMATSRHRTEIMLINDEILRRNLL